MRYKIPGHERKTVKSCALETQVLLGNVKPKKPRKERAKETSPRKQEEAELRRKVIKWLRSKGYLVKRIENGVCGHLGRGVPDILFFTHNRMFWLELKSKFGVLKKEQIEFRDRCIISGINYIEARGMNEIEEKISMLMKIKLI